MSFCGWSVYLASILKLICCLLMYTDSADKIIAQAKDKSALIKANAKEASEKHIAEATKKCESVSALLFLRTLYCLQFFTGGKTIPSFRVCPVLSCHGFCPC